MFDVNIFTQSDITREIEAAVKELETLEVLVGIPQEESARSSEVNNAQLLYIHTHGSAVNNIPPRPVIEPAIEDNKDTIGDMLKEAATAALEGDSAGIHSALNKAGMHGQNVARGWFDDPKNNWAANKPETIKRKGSDKPLIDTAEMRKSIVFVVREK